MSSRSFNSYTFFPTSRGCFPSVRTFFLPYRTHDRRAATFSVRAQPLPSSPPILSRPALVGSLDGRRQGGSCSCSKSLSDSGVAVAGLGFRFRGCRGRAPWPAVADRKWRWGSLGAAGWATDDNRRRQAASLVSEWRCGWWFFGGAAGGAIAGGRGKQRRPAVAGAVRVHWTWTVHAVAPNLACAGVRKVFLNYYFLIFSSFCPPQITISFSWDSFHTVDLSGLS
jgi:hypothetical protein